MNFNKLTIKASEAIQEANSICSSRENSQISTEHLFYAMIEQNDWYLPAILRKLNANKEQIKAETLLLIDALPRIQWSSQIALSSELNKILEDSEKIMKEMGDSYITTEHFFLSILKWNNKVKNMLEKLNIDYKTCYNTIISMRKWEKVESNDRYRITPKFSCDRQKGWWYLYSPRE